MYMLIFQYLRKSRAQNFREMVLVPSRKWNSFNNSKKDGKFGIDVVESMLNTLQTLELANVSQLLTSTWKHYHTQLSPNIIQWFIYMRPLWNMLYNVRSVLRKESTQFVPNFKSFLKLLNEFWWWVRCVHAFSPWWVSWQQCSVHAGDAVCDSLADHTIVNCHCQVWRTRMLSY